MMKKILNNRVATLLIAVALLLLATVMLLGAFEVRAFSFTRDILRLLVAAALALYTALFLSVEAYRRKGTEQRLILLEIAVLLLLCLSQVAVQFFDLPIISTMQVCAVFGFVVALRFALMTVMAYHAKGKKGDIPLSRFCLYLAVFALGVWQMASPAVRDKHFLFVLGGAALMGAIFFVLVTVRNFQVYRKTAPKSQRKKKAALPSAEEKE